MHMQIFVITLQHWFFKTPIMVKIDLTLNFKIVFSRPKSAKPSVQPSTEEPEDKLVATLRRWIESL